MFHDDFDGPALDTEAWRLPTWSPATFVGRTQFRVAGSNLPAVVDGAVRLELSSYNPTNLPNGPPTFYGTDLIGPSLELGSGLVVTIRAKFESPVVGGIVGGLFGYRFNDATYLHDEIDTELLTNWHVDGSRRVQTNIYANEPLGAGSPNAFVLPWGEITDYHTYTMQWLPDRVSWLVDGQLMYTQTSVLPQGPMVLHLNIWAPAAEWAEAYDPSLTATSNPAENASYFLHVDYVSIHTASAVSTPARLAILSQPVDLTACVPADRDLVVAVEDAAGHMVTTANTLVTLSVAQGPGNITGTTSVNAVNGLATFSRITIDTAGTYVLTAHAQALEPATTSTINVNPDTTPARLPGDVNCDDRVDIVDLAIVANHWQDLHCGWIHGDLDGNGIVDIVDLSIVANNWQRTAAPPAAQETATVIETSMAGTDPLPAFAALAAGVITPTESIILAADDAQGALVTDNPARSGIHMMNRDYSLDRSLLVLDDLAGVRVGRDVDIEIRRPAPLYRHARFTVPVIAVSRVATDR